jgi:hypothetical protein
MKSDILESGPSKNPANNRIGRTEILCLNTRGWKVKKVVD